ncbi:MAG: hypothetical protein ACOYCA_03045 [Eggerthellaceae bacterium]|jgi:hypothetical protein
MPEILDHIEYLSKEIGPRPAGTQEEQQAALYITEQFQKEAKLSAVIEDFNGATGDITIRDIYCGVTFLVALLAVIFPILDIPALVIATASCVLFIADVWGRPLLAPFIGKGVSQNVVAKYQPTAENGENIRRRKIILLAHYDSGRVDRMAKPGILRIMPQLMKATFVCMIAIPVLLLLRATFFLNISDVALVVFNALMIIAMVAVAIPVIRALVMRFGSYNEGANNNAAGVSVLMDVAKEVGRGCVSEAELDDQENIEIHSEEEAYDEGLVPDGAELVYEESVSPRPHRSSEPAEGSDASLRAAKQAIAALTGQKISTDPVVSHDLPEVHDPDGEAREAYIQEDIVVEDGKPAVREEEYPADVTPREVSADASATQVIHTTPMQAESFSDDSVPDWFERAQERAKKPTSEVRPEQRSRYATALDAAVGASRDAFDAANERTKDELHRIEDQQQDIVEVKAPLHVSSSLRDTNASAPQGAASATLEDNEPAYSETEVFEASGEAEATRVVEEMQASEEAVAEFGDASETASSRSDENRVAVELSEEDKLAADVDLQAQKPSRTEQMPPVEEVASRPKAVSDVETDTSRPSVKAERMRKEELSAETDLADTEATDKKDVKASGLSESGKIRARKNLSKNLPKPGEPDKAETSDEESSPTRTGKLRALRANLPSPEEKKEEDLSRTGKLRALRTNLPSMSGSIRAVDENGNIHVRNADVRNVDDERPSVKVQREEAEAAPAAEEDFYAEEVFEEGVATEVVEGSTEPVEDEYVYDEEEVARTEESPSYVNIEEGASFYDDEPELEERHSRFRHNKRGGFFNRIRTRREEREQEDDYSQEWFDSDGSYKEDEYFDYDDTDEEPLSARERIKDRHERLSYQRQQMREEAEPAHSPERDHEYGEDEWEGGAFSRKRMGYANPAHQPEEEGEEDTPRDSDSREFEKIYHFRNPQINSEVWFVALGCEHVQHEGIREFIAAHGPELRGAILVDLDALGAGELTLINEEGGYKVSKPSSRVKRGLKKASQASEVPYQTESVKWLESAASYASKRGYQAIHLVGVEDGKPALLNEVDDVMENLDENRLYENADFLMEFLKNI